jgi:hypothetical protein
MAFVWITNYCLGSVLVKAGISPFAAAFSLALRSVRTVSSLNESVFRRHSGCGLKLNIFFPQYK